MITWLVFVSVQPGTAVGRGCRLGEGSGLSAAGYSHPYLTHKAIAISQKNMV